MTQAAAATTLFNTGITVAHHAAWHETSNHIRLWTKGQGNFQN